MIERLKWENILLAGIVISLVFMFLIQKLFGNAGWTNDIFLFFVTIFVFCVVALFLMYYKPKRQEENYMDPYAEIAMREGYYQELGRQQGRQQFYEEQRRIREEERRRAEEEREIKQMQRERITFDYGKVNKNLENYARGFYPHFGKKGKKIKL